MLQDKVSKASSVVIADYAGTTVADQVKLRADVKAAGGEILVTKNTLVDLAVGKGKLSESLKGMNAVIFGYADPVAPIKAIFEFRKKAEKLVIKQGYMDDRVLSPSEVEALSKLPGKQELLTKLVMLLKAPANNLVGTLNALPGKLVRTLDAVAKRPVAE